LSKSLDPIVRVHGAGDDDWWVCLEERMIVGYVWGGYDCACLREENCLVEGMIVKCISGMEWLCVVCLDEGMIVVCLDEGMIVVCLEEGKCLGEEIIVEFICWRE
jgi:hypothetical protein